jgi:uncharacterized membrane protein
LTTLLERGPSAQGGLAYWLDQSLEVLSRGETPLDIGRPAAEIYAYLADFPRHPEWAHTYLSIEPLTPGPPRVGSRYRVREKQDLRSDKLPYTTVAHREGVDYVSELEVIALELNQRIGWRSQVQGGPFSAEGAFVLEPVTDVITTVRMRMRLTGAQEQIRSWMLDLQARGYPLDIIARQVDRAMHNLRTILEGRAKRPDV